MVTKASERLRRVRKKSQEGHSWKSELPEPVIAHRWLVEVYEAALAHVPAGLRPKREPAEIFHEILEHRWYLSEEAGRDVGLDAAVRSYVETVLRSVPDERTVLSSGLEPEEPDLGV